MTCDLCQKPSDRCLPVPTCANGIKKDLWLCPQCYTTADPNTIYELSREIPRFDNAAELAYERERFA